jgi:LmbE family N-acetylglucosaminyl deacetylase
MARWASEGTEITLVVVTNGAAGSNDPSLTRHELIATREREQNAAADLVGVRRVIFLGYEDGFVEDSPELRRDLIREIRRHKPEVVVGPDPALYYFDQGYINHPDHRRVGEALLAALNPGATTVPLYRSELYDQGFAPHQVKACLLNGSPSSDYFVDIGEHIERKVEALRAHNSQMAEWEGLDEAVDSMARMSASRGAQLFSKAEAFKAIFFDRPFPPPWANPDAGVTAGKASS